MRAAYLLPPAATTRARRAMASVTGTASRSASASRVAVASRAAVLRACSSCSRVGKCRYKVARATPAAAATSAMLGGSPPPASRSAAASRIAAATTVLFTVVAAATLLLALLGFLGMRVLSHRERRRLAAEGPAPDGTSGMWTRLAAFVQRHPAPLAAVAATVMLVLAIPVLSLRLGSSDAANDPASTTTHQAYDLLADGFGPGFNGPLLLVGTTTSPADSAAFTRLAGTLKTVPG